MQYHQYSSNLMSPKGEESLQSFKDLCISFIVKPLVCLLIFKGIPTAVRRNFGGKKKKKEKKPQQVFTGLAQNGYSFSGY